MAKTKVIGFANNKGGSGKSTSCANVGYELAASGHKVLLIDGDMQLNLSLTFFNEDQVLEFARGQENLYYVIKNQQDLSPCIRHTDYENLDIVSSSTLMSSIEYELFTKWNREYILKKALAPIIASGEYDYILIDAPPTLGGWVMNILCSCNHLIIPVEASPWGLFGLANMFDFLNSTKEMAPQLSVLGILVTKVDERKNYFRQTLDTLDTLEDIHTFTTHIHVDSSIEWSQDDSKPVAAYKRSSRSSIEYKALAKEIDELCQ